MALYWAKFQHGPSGTLYRLDTRIYLADVPKCATTDPVIGAVVAKNPGSAQPSSATVRSLQPITLSNDSLLPNVRSIVTKAYADAQLQLPRRGYVQVLNLFYLCDNKFERALRAFNYLTEPLNDPAETRAFPWVMYCWGKWNRRIAPLAARFADLNAPAHFYFDKELDEIVTGVPADGSFAKHTQGLVHQPVVEHLAALLTANAV